MFLYFVLNLPSTFAMSARTCMTAIAVFMSLTSVSQAQFNMLPVSIDRDGIVVIVGRKIHCLRGRPDEVYRWSNRAIPEFPEVDNVSLATRLGATAVPDHDGECYLLLGKHYVTVDENEHIIVSDKTDDRSRWIVTKIGGHTHADGDKIKIYTFAKANSAAPKKYIGLGKTTLTLKDLHGKEHHLLSCVLTVEHNAAHVLVNDYSGK